MVPDIVWRLDWGSIIGIWRRQMRDRLRIWNQLIRLGDVFLSGA
jgi:hypothetical protein